MEPSTGQNDSTLDSECHLEEDSVTQAIPEITTENSTETTTKNVFLFPTSLHT